MLHDLHFKLKIKTCEGNITIKVDPGMTLIEVKNKVLVEGPKQLKDKKLENNNKLQPNYYDFRYRGCIIKNNDLTIKDVGVAKAFLLVCKSKEKQ